MSDYFEFAAARTNSVASDRAVRPSQHAAVLDGIDDPFAAVAPFAGEGPEPLHPTPARPTTSSRSDGNELGRAAPRSTDLPGRPTPGTELPELRPPEPTPNSTPVDFGGVPEPATGEPTEINSVRYSPVESLEPAVERAQVEPPTPPPFVPASPSPTSQPDPEFVVGPAGPNRPADLPPVRDAPHSESEPSAVAPAEPTALDLDALAMADAFMRDVIEPRPDRAEELAFDDVVAPTSGPQVVIDRVTVEIVAPARPIDPPPGPGRVARAGARLGSGRRADRRWGS